MSMSMISLEDLRNIANDEGIPVLSVASVSSWDSDTIVSRIVLTDMRPGNIMDGCKVAIVLGLPIGYAMERIDGKRTYVKAYDIMNDMIDDAMERIAGEIIDDGHNAVVISRNRRDSKVIFSNRCAAYLAGIGTFGANNSTITERYGPRIRFGTILSDIDVETSVPMDHQICTGCMGCVRICPQHLITYARPLSIIDVEGCAEYSKRSTASGKSPCERCIDVCPIGK